MIRLLLVLALAAPQDTLRVSPGGSTRLEPAVEVDAVQRMRAVESRLGDGQFLRRPWLAAEMGLDCGRLGLGQFGSDGASWWKSLLRGADADLAAIRTERLTPSQRVRYEGLRAWIRKELLLATAMPREPFDPVLYVDTAERSLRVQAECVSVDPVRRALEATQILKELPKLWRAAKVGLVAPSSDWRVEASQRIHDLSIYIEIDLPKAFQEIAWDPEAERLFDRYRTEALLATDDFLRFLEAFRARTNAPPQKFGSTNWAQLMAAAAGDGYTTVSLKARLLEDLASLDRAIRELDVDDPLPGVEADPAVLAELVREASRAGMRLARDASLLEPVAAADLLHPRWREGCTLPGPVARVLSRGDGGYYLDIEAFGEVWAQPLVQTRDRLLTPGGLRALAVRYGFPGEAYFIATQYQGRSPRRAPLLSRCRLEGWGLYAVDWTARARVAENPLQRDTAFVAAARRMLLVEAARLLAAIELHVDDLTLDEAASRFRRRTGFDAKSAQCEAQAAQHDPQYGIGYLGLLEYRETELALLSGGSPEQALKGCLSIGMLQPEARLSDLRRYVLEAGTR